MAAHQAPLSLGFSRQEHWSGLPFPSPMHESEKWKWSHSVVSMDCNLPGSSIHGIFQARVLEWGAIAFWINPREYQIVRIHRKETTWIQDLASPNHKYHPVQDTSAKQQTTKIQTQSSVDRITTSFSLAQQRTNKHTQNLSTNLTLFEAYTNHWTNLRRAKTKRKKEFSPEAWEKKTSNTIS